MRPKTAMMVKKIRGPVIHLHKHKIYKLYIFISIKQLWHLALLHAESQVRFIY